MPSHRSGTPPFPRPGVSTRAEVFPSATSSTPRSTTGQRTGCEQTRVEHAGSSAGRSTRENAKPRYLSTPRSETTETLEVLETLSPLQTALLRQIGSRLLDGYSEREIQRQLRIDDSLMTRYLELMKREFPLDRKD